MIKFSLPTPTNEAVSGDMHTRRDAMAGWLETTWQKPLPRGSRRPVFAGEVRRE